MGLIAVRVIHLVAAAIWFGGIVFIATVAVPFARTFGEDRRSEIAGAIGRRFRPVSWTALAALVVSGAYMLYRFGWLSWTALQATEYGKGLTIKIGLAGIVIVLAALHDFVLGPRAESDARARRTAVMLARVNGVLSLLVLILGVLLAH
jgi:copper resistance protein D